MGRFSKEKTLDRPVVSSPSSVLHAMSLWLSDSVFTSTSEKKAMTAPRVRSSAEMIEKRPRQELNLIYDLRRVACCPSHSEDRLCFITPPRNRTSPGCFEDSHASSTLARHVDLVLKSRRLDSHQHKSVYKTGAFLSRATSAEAAIAAAQARGFEPRLSVLEADCSPRSTLVML